MNRKPYCTPALITPWVRWSLPVLHLNPPGNLTLHPKCAPTLKAHPNLLSLSPLFVINPFPNLEIKSHQAVQFLLFRPSSFISLDHPVFVFFGHPFIFFMTVHSRPDTIFPPDQNLELKQSRLWTKYGISPVMVTSGFQFISEKKNRPLTLLVTLWEYPKASFLEKISKIYF